MAFTLLWVICFENNSIIDKKLPKTMNIQRINPNASNKLAVNVFNIALSIYSRSIKVYKKKAVDLSRSGF